ncbi:hypothetical protein SAMD00019534_001170 [Acytostelium subglobosum LB1]|uniref:hypothetical protein n=1 Tax=Acytostelium subglobosum LB1 TaxID=1410327 RepID=UPI0006448BC8|nr:hypothetical protein SAMD00019534_001170 [Acytostelium subglobosum LB1]GAM16942.1 hypothetical protein SAMD00019534_001170 [Acytostelium subglobosum LB1]|eukprot:XP_012759004.1 hypothetical protein SAMD00019534_001170 [Acytostelium subglobosum LB1]
MSTSPATHTPSETFQESELDKYYALFCSFDTNKSSTLDLKEFKAAFQSKLGFSDATTEGMFKACDVNKDGVIDLREFLALISIIVKSSPEEKLVFLFHLYDKDRSGSLDNAELVQICASLAQVGRIGGKADQLHLSVEELAKADTNKDGVVSLPEWVDYGLKNPVLLELLKGYEL